MSRKDHLVVALREVLVPEFQRRGFTSLPLSEDDASSTEIQSAFPFGRLRRAATSGIQQAEIQIDKRGRAAFRVNFGTFPRKGLQHARGFVTVEEVWVQYLPTYGELYASAWRRRWFELGADASDARCQALAERAGELIHEIDSALEGRWPRWWSGHVRRVCA